MFWIHSNRMTQTHFGYMQHTIRKYENQQIIVFYLVGFVGDCSVICSSKAAIPSSHQWLYHSLCEYLAIRSTFFFLFFMDFILFSFSSVTVCIFIHLFSDSVCSVPLFCIEFIRQFSFYRDSFFYVVHWIYEQEATQIVFFFPPFLEPIVLSSREQY